MEHDSSLYEDANVGPILSVVAGTLGEVARETLVVLYAPKLDPTLKILSRRADRVFCIEEAKRARYSPGSQSTLEAFGQMGLCTLSQDQS